MEKRKGFINDQIYEAVRQDIINFRYKPGEKLSESIIANEYEVSRTPVRSVFQRLEAEHLVRIEPQRGTFVTRLDYTYINSMIYMRLCIEFELMRKIALAQDHHVLSQFSANVAQQATVLHGNHFDPAEFNALDNEFHRLCYRAYDKDPLWQIIDRMNVHYTRFRKLNMIAASSFEQALHDHEQILSLMRGVQIEPLRELLRAHLYTGLQTAQGVVKSEFAEFFEFSDAARPF